MESAPSPKNLSWRLVALGLLLGGLLAAGALWATWPDEPADGRETPRVLVEPHDDAMTANERCAHMPEHCEEGGP